MSEPSKTRTVEIDNQWVVRGHKHVDSQIEFLVADNERIVDVALDDVGFGSCAVICPFRYLTDFLEQEYALALTPANRFHDPDTFVLHVAFELFQVDRVLTGEVVGERQVVIGVRLLDFAFLI